LICPLTGCLKKIKMHKFVLLICTLIFLATPSSVNTQQIVPLFAALIEKSLKNILSRVARLRPEPGVTVNSSKIIHSEALLVDCDPHDSAEHLTEMAA
jgi:hypothetical protein